MNNKKKHLLKWMKASARVLIPGLVLAGVTSCLRDIVPYDDQAHISIDVDWSLMDEDPTGMTVIFYPTDGSQPYSYVTNEVHHIERSLPEKEYDVLIFNQSIPEFSTINFRGMDMLNTAEAYAPEMTDTSSRIDRLYKGGGRGYNASGHTQPKSLGSTSIGVRKPTRGYNASGHAQPKPRIGQLTANIHVLGLNNALTVNGAITGLASGSFLSNGNLNNISLTQELDQWNMTPEADNGIGTITTSTGTYGLSPNIDYSFSSARPDSRGEFEMNYIESSEEDDFRNILYLNFLLKDYTYVSYRFDVTDNIKDFTTEIEIELVLNLGTDLQEYLDLPSTGFPYTSTPVSVTPWGDEVVEHDIKL